MTPDPTVERTSRIRPRKAAHLEYPTAQPALGLALYSVMRG